MSETGAGSLYTPIGTPLKPPPPRAPVPLTDVEFQPTKDQVDALANALDDALIINGVTYYKMPGSITNLTADGRAFVEQGGNLYSRAGAVLTPEEFGARPSTMSSTVDVGAQLQDWAHAVSVSGLRGLLPKLPGCVINEEPDLHDLVPPSGLQWFSSKPLVFSQDGLRLDLDGILHMLKPTDPAAAAAARTMKALSFAMGDRTNREYGGLLKTDPTTGKLEYYNIWQNRAHVHGGNIICDYNWLGTEHDAADHFDWGHFQVWGALGHGLQTSRLREGNIHDFYLIKCMDGPTDNASHPVFDMSDQYAGDPNNTFRISRGHILSPYGLPVLLDTPHRYDAGSGGAQGLPLRFIDLDLHVEGNASAELFDTMRTQRPGVPQVWIRRGWGVTLNGTISGTDNPSGDRVAVRVGDATLPASEQPNVVDIDAYMFSGASSTGDGVLLDVVGGTNIRNRQRLPIGLAPGVIPSRWGPNVDRSYNGRLERGHRTLSDSMLVHQYSSGFSVAGILDALSSTRVDTRGSIPGQLPYEIGGRAGVMQTQFNAVAGSVSRVSGAQALQVSSGPDLLWSAAAQSEVGQLGGIWGTLSRAGNANDRGGNQNSSGVNGLYSFAAMFPQATDGSPANNPLTWAPAITDNGGTLIICAGRNDPLNPDRALQVQNAVVASLPARAQYLVVGFPLADSERAAGSGNAQTAAVLQTQQRMREQFGIRFIDWEAIHSKLGCTTPDGLHPETRSNWACAQAVVDRHLQLGWGA